RDPQDRPRDAQNPRDQEARRRARRRRTRVRAKPRRRRRRRWRGRALRRWLDLRIFGAAPPRQRRELLDLLLHLLEIARILGDLLVEAVGRERLAQLLLAALAKRDVHQNIWLH